MRDQLAPPGRVEGRAARPGRRPRGSQPGSQASGPAALPTVLGIDVVQTLGDGGRGSVQVGQRPEAGTSQEPGRHWAAGRRRTGHREEEDAVPGMRPSAPPYPAARSRRRGQTWKPSVPQFPDLIGL